MQNVQRTQNRTHTYMYLHTECMFSDIIEQLLFGSSESYNGLFVSMEPFCTKHISASISMSFIWCIMIKQVRFYLYKLTEFPSWHDYYFSCSLSVYVYLLYTKLGLCFFAYVQFLYKFLFFSKNIF